MHRFFITLLLGFCCIGGILGFSALSARAATCDITSTTTIDQVYVDGNSCDTLNLIGGGGITVTWDGPINLAGAGMIQITSGTTFFDGSLALDSSDSLLVESTGILTHATGSVDGLNISASSLTIQAGGRIDTDGAGCQGGYGGTPGEGGYGPNLVTGVCEINGAGAGVYQLGGAGYGGTGGTGYYSNRGGVRYGTSTSPTYLGSGGAAEYSPQRGGNGGGYIRLAITGTLENNGSISANGTAGTPANGGGGSGGSVYIQAGSLIGSGYISANGGNGQSGSGAGGGGRIALYTGSRTFSIDNITVSKGIPGIGVMWNIDQADGSVYLLDRYSDDGAGSVTVLHGFDISNDLDLTRDTITIEEGTNILCRSGLVSITIRATTFEDRGSNWNCTPSTLRTVDVSSTHLNVNNALWSFQSASSVQLTADVNASTTGVAFSFSSATSVILSSPSWEFGVASSTWNAPAPGSVVTFDFDPTDLVFTQFHLLTGPSAIDQLSRWVFPDGIGLTLASSTIITNVSSTLASLSIDENSALSADRTGCEGGYGGLDSSGYGPNLTTGLCELGAAGAGLDDLGGASYGGRGSTGYFAGKSGALYGLSAAPLDVGSGGASEFPNQRGGNGGGRMRLRVTGTVNVDGVLSADGGIGVGNGGGGSGGSLFLQASNLTGSGTISADGGDGLDAGGGGGGGRLAVLYSASTFLPAHVTVSPGVAGARTGLSREVQAGSAYLLDRYTDDGSGNMILLSGFEVDSSFDGSRGSILIRPSTQVHCASTLTSIDISTNSFIDQGSLWSCSSSLLTALTVSSSAMSVQDASWSFTAPSSVRMIGSSSIATRGSLFSFDSATSVSLLTPEWDPGSASSTWNVPAGGAVVTFDFSSSSVTLTQFHLNTGISNSERQSRWVFPDGIALSFASSTINANVSTTLASLSLDENSSLTATGSGCEGGYGGPDSSGYGPNLTTGQCELGAAGAGLDDLGGAGYGGAGGDGWFTARGGAEYGVSTTASYLGSGGAAEFSPGRGGNGGGRIGIVSTGSVTIDGSIHASGTRGVINGGGGSGGSVSIRASSINGSGYISANGADGYDASGGGAGGRISLVYQSVGTFDVSHAVALKGLKGSRDNGNLRDGTDGTVYTLRLNTSPSVPSSLGPTALVNGSATGTSSPILHFSLSDPDGSDTVKYQVQIDDSSDFSSPLVDYTSALVAQGSTSFQVGQSAGSGVYNITSSSTLPNGSYYWRVRAIDGSDAISSYAVARGGAVAFVVDGTPRMVSFERSSGAGLENVSATSIRIVLDQVHFEDVTVAYAASSTTSTASGSGTDFTLASGTATIAAGQTSTTISLSIVNDTSVESSEVVVIELSSPTNASLGATTTYTYVIEDDDVPVTSPSRGGASNDGFGGYGSVLPPSTIFSITGATSTVSTIAPTPPSPLVPSQPFLPVETVLNPSDVEILIDGTNGSRDFSEEERVRALIVKDALEFRLVLKEEDAVSLTNFVVYGISPQTRSLGSGERHAVIRDLMQTQGTTHILAKDMERVVRGLIPVYRNVRIEQQQLRRVRQTFLTIYGHDPDFRNERENLAWNTLMYRLRFPRDLGREREGINAFRRLFRRDPQDPFQWAVVRVLGYVKR